MNKKDYLAIQEIYQYQDMSESEISAVFFTLGVQRAATLFHLMLQSFKITARVANAGWRLFSVLRTVLKPNEKTWIPQTVMAEVEQSLHDYSPDNFRPHIADLEFASACFEQFYNDASTKETKEEIEELIFEWTKKLHEQLEAKKGEYVKPTVDEVRRRPVHSG